MTDNIRPELDKLLSDCGVDAEKVDRSFLPVVARHFAQWQKVQMMREAMPRVVKHLDSISYNHCIAHLGLKDNDQVKIIIIKPDNL